MSSNGSTTHPDWQHAVIREAGIRRALILEGNVRDPVYDPQERQYVRMPEFLIRVLRRDPSLGFTLAGVWDQADGLRFPDDQSRRRFEEVLRATNLPQAGRTDGGTPYDAGTGPARDARPQPNGLLADPLELLAAIRRLIGHGSERPLFILDFAHLLVTDPAHPDTQERQWLLQLGKALVGEGIVPMDSDHLRQGNGLVVLITPNLGALPVTIYQGDPRVRLITIPPPSRSERHAFFVRHSDDLRCERPRPVTAGLAIEPLAGGRNELAEALADLTDQLTLADLRQILSLCMQTSSPLPPERLLNLYRFGDQRSPWEELGEEKLRTVDDAMKRRVIGQDEAVRHVATMIIRAYLGLAGLQHSAGRSKPKGILFFVGPTGVGKTELAKAIAEFLFGDETACIRFDMSEYNHEHSDQRLVGAPPGYIGHEQGGQLTNAVRQRPFSVLLFDEIEKAHGRVLDKFLQVFEDGRMTDGRGETAHFSHCVIILTSNIGAAEMPDTDDRDVLRNHFLKAVEDHFVRTLGRPELLNRLGDNIVVFNPITDDGFRRKILAKKIEPLQQYLQERYGIALRLAEGTEEHFLRNSRSDHGGRGVVNVIERDLVNPLARFLFDHLHQLRRGRVAAGSLADGQLVFDLVEA